MGARVRKDHALVYANVGVHADVEIPLALDGNGGEASVVHCGHDGPDLFLDFADLDGRERLAVVATDGVRRIRGRITADDRAATTDSDVDLLVGAGAAR